MCANETEREQRLGEAREGDRMMRSLRATAAAANGSGGSSSHSCCSSGRSIGSGAAVSAVLRQQRRRRRGRSCAASAVALEAAEAPADAGGSASGEKAAVFAERNEREFQVWKRQCEELPIKVMREDALFFDDGDRSPFSLLGLEAPTFTTSSFAWEDGESPATVEAVEDKYAAAKSGWKLAADDQQLERASWETLQMMEQELLLAANPNFDRKFFFYSPPTDASLLDEDGKPLMHAYALVKRARDVLVDKDRRELYLELQMAAKRAQEWEEQIKDVLGQIPDETMSFPDSMWEGEDPSTWEVNP